MKVVLFDGLLSGAPVRLFCGQDVDVEAMIADPSAAGLEARVLDGTPFADAMRLAALPLLPEFDAACAAQTAQP